MKTASGALISLLANQSTYVMADLYTFTLASGVVLRYTSFDADIKLAGNTFSHSAGVLVQRSRLKSQVGVVIDELTLSMNFDQTTVITAGITMAQLLRRGDFDGCVVQVERVFNGTDTSAGSLVLFIGRIAEITTLTSTDATIKVESMTALLNMNLPRNLIQPACFHSLFDAGCTLSKAAFAAANTIGGASTVNTIILGTNSGQATGYYDLGMLLISSGINSGFSVSIKSYTNPNTLRLNRPLPFAVPIGASITIYPGCDKQQATCSGKFSNLVNFNGFPYVPVPETAI